MKHTTRHYPQWSYHKWAVGDWFSLEWSTIRGGYKSIRLFRFSVSYLK